MRIRKPKSMFNLYLVLLVPAQIIRCIHMSAYINQCSTCTWFGLCQFRQFDTFTCQRSICCTAWVHVLLQCDKNKLRFPYIRKWDKQRKLFSWDSPSYTYHTRKTTRAKTTHAKTNTIFIDVLAHTRTFRRQ